MQTVDLQSQHRAYYHAHPTPELVQVEGGRFLSMLGTGSPGTDVFYDKKRALRRIVEQLAEDAKPQGRSFLLPPLEISYWYSHVPVPVTIGEFYTTYPLEHLEYRIMMRLPDYVTQRDVSDAAKRLAAHGEVADYATEIFEMSGGSVLQILHTGPFADELETLKRMQEFADVRKVRKSGPHHEIHLTDWQKGQNQAHLETILRDPVEPVRGNRRSRRGG